MTLVEGRRYLLARSGEEVVFSGMNRFGKAIVHPPGEPDMQSSSVVPVEDLLPLNSVGRLNEVPLPSNSRIGHLLKDDILPDDDS